MFLVMVHPSRVAAFSRGSTFRRSAPLLLRDHCKRNPTAIRLYKNLDTQVRVFPHIKSLRPQTFFTHNRRRYSTLTSLRRRRSPELVLTNARGMEFAYGLKELYFSVLSRATITKSNVGDSTLDCVSASGPHANGPLSSIS